MGRRLMLIVPAVMVGLLVPGSAMAMPDWRLTAIPIPSGAIFSTLSAVSCTSSTACTAVGGYQIASGRSTPLVLRWNGETWTPQHVPTPTDAGGVLQGVSCVSARFCIAVGGFAERWNGSTWTVMPSADGTTVWDDLRSVSCASADWCVAVGEGGGPAPLAETWNGRRWTLASGLPGFGSLEGVSCISKVFCVAVGTEANFPALVERWNGSTWESSFVGDPYSYLTGVACRSANRCIAVGYQDPQDDGTDSMWVRNWNGSAWSPQPVSGLGSLMGVSCASLTACTAVGGPGLERAETLSTVAFGWNGSSWMSESPLNPPGSTSARLNGVSCPTPTLCIAVGGAYFGRAGQAFAEEN